MKTFTKFNAHSQQPPSLGARARARAARGTGPALAPRPRARPGLGQDARRGGRVAAGPGLVSRWAGPELKAGAGAGPSALDGLRIVVSIVTAALTELRAVAERGGAGGGAGTAGGGEGRGSSRAYVSESDIVPYESDHDQYNSTGLVSGSCSPAGVDIQHAQVVVHRPGRPRRPLLAIAQGPQARGELGGGAALSGRGLGLQLVGGGEVEQLGACERIYTKFA